MRFRYVFSAWMLLGVPTAFCQQSGAVCSATGTVTQLRQTGQAELAGDVEITCMGFGSSSGVAGNVQIFLNTSFSGRVVSFATAATEALLMVDNPAPSQQVAQAAGTTVVGANVFQGTLASPNSILWTRIPIIPPTVGTGQGFTRVLRIVNIRLQVAGLGPAAQAQAVMNVGFTGPGVPPINNPNVLVGVTAVDQRLAVRQPDDSAAFAGNYQSCAGNKPMVSASTPVDFNLKFSEVFAAAFKERNAGSSAANPAVLADQNQPGLDYGTESAFFNSSFPAANGMNMAGLASQGTRLMARFTGIPAGVNIYVTALPVVPGSSTTGITARLVATDAAGEGPFTTVPPTIGPYAQVAVVGGTGLAVWEVVDPSVTAIESLSFGVVVSIPANFATAANVAVSGQLGPASAVNTASPAAPLPRFVPTATAMMAATISACVATVTITTQCPLPDATKDTAYLHTFQATGGMAPFTWTFDIAVVIPGLTLDASGRLFGVPATAGLFAFRIRVTDNTKNTAAKDCSVRVLGGFQVFPVALNYFATSGGAPAPAQSVSITSVVPGIDFGVAISVLTTVRWLRASVLSGRMPEVVEFVADPSMLAAGTHQGLVNIVSTSASPNIQPVAVTFNVGPRIPPALGVEPSGLTVAAPRGGAARGRVLNIFQRGAGNLAFVASATTFSGGNWIAISPASGTATPGNPVKMSVTLTPAVATVGSHRGRIAITTAGTGEVIIVPVALGVSSGAEAMVLSQTGLEFTARAGGTSTPPRRFQILSDGVNGFDWRITTTIDSGPQGWVSLSQNAGRSQPGSPSTVEVRIDSQGLVEGLYLAELLVEAAAVGNAPRSLFVVLRILSGADPPEPVIDPGGLLFVAPQGGANPARQTALVQNLSASPFSIDFDLSTGDNIWSIRLPRGNTVNPGSTAAIDVGANAAGLAAGVYRADLALQFSGDPRVRVMELVLIVASGATPTAGGVRGANGACMPSKLVVLAAGIRLGLVAAGGLPVSLRAEVRDDCGSPLAASGNAVNVSFSTGNPPPFSLVGLGGGMWEGTWQVQTTSPAQPVITFDAIDSGRNLQGTLQVGGAVNRDADFPVVRDGGVTSASSFLSNIPLAAGGLVSIFGSRLADGISASPSPPFPARLGTTTVAVGGKVVPLFFAQDVGGNSQVNGMLPYDLEFDTGKQLVVKRQNAGYSVTEIVVTSSQPGIFVLPTIRPGQGAVLDLQAAIPVPSSPVPRGDFIQIFCEGLGPVDGPVVAGQPVPSNRLFRTARTVVVTIGGVVVPAADIPFAGLAPGFSGLYQVNARVPVGIAPGDSVPVTLTIDGQASNVVLIAVR